MKLTGEIHRENRMKPQEHQEGRAGKAGQGLCGPSQAGGGITRGSGAPWGPRPAQGPPFSLRAGPGVSEDVTQGSGGERRGRPSVLTGEGQGAGGAPGAPSPPRFPGFPGAAGGAGWAGSTAREPPWSRDAHLDQLALPILTETERRLKGPACGKAPPQLFRGT